MTFARPAAFAFSISLRLAALACVLGLLAAARAEADDFDSSVKPFLATHCVKCHGPEKQEGDLRIDSLAREFGNERTAAKWTEIMDRLNSGEMPPDEEPRPDVGQTAKVTEWIAGELTEAEAVRQAASGEVISFRRLSREEYRNTIRDLLGVTFDVTDPTGLPEDPDWQGFERIGSVLSLSPAHVEKYLAAADTILSEALALGPEPKTETIRWTAAQLRVSDGLQRQLAARGLLDQVRADIVPNNGALDIRDLKIETTGDYILRAKLSGLGPKGGKAARFRIYATDVGRTLLEQDVEAAEDRPITLEVRTHLPAGTHLIRLVNAVPGPNPEDRRSRPLNSKPFFRMSERQPWQIKLTDDDGQPIWPTILLDWVEWQGPMHESWPPPAHQQIFFAGDGATKDRAYAREIVSRFATRAFRRRAEPVEVDRLMQVFDKAQQLGDGFEPSVKTALSAVLCSHQFLYLVEGSASTPSPKLNDWELASRLSYFLWSSMPDERLMQLAGAGKLHESDVLREEVRRMMRDPKAAAFADSFPRQWLQLRRVGMFEPDRKIYPDYDEYLEKSMVAETLGFFGQVLEKNLPLREFLTSNWTVLNERLAGHYGIEGVAGEAMQRVEIAPDDHRGGLLTQAAILSLTSDGTRHRPVHRGKWVLESIYGTPPPPPPPNVTAIKPAAPDEKKTTLRAKLEVHRDHAQCAACHRKIDPLGLAFDQYDAIGHWRTEEVVRDGAGDNPKLDPSGELADGRKFADADGLKLLVLADLDKFAAALTSKLATYGLRRGMTFDDRKSLSEITLQAKSEDYRLGSMIENLVLSDLFQHR